MSKPVPIPREVVEGLTAARDSQKGLLLHNPMLVAFLEESGFDVTASWVRGNPNLTARAFFHGFEVNEEETRSPQDRR